MGRTEDEVTEFFHRYAEAWNAADAEVLSTFFAVPYLIATKNSTTFYETVSESVANIETLILSYTAQGVVSRWPIDIDVNPLPDEAAAVQLKWRLSGLADQVIAEVPTAYTLTSEEGVWQIVAVDLKNFRSREPIGS
jgi:hypothetical protein